MDDHFADAPHVQDEADWSRVDAEAVEDYLPGEPVLSSGDAWDGLVAQVHEEFVFPQPRSVPGIEDHGLYLHLETPTRLERWLEGHGDDAADVDAGNVTVVPSGRQTNWQWSDRIRIMHLYLEPDRLHRAAEEAAGVDPDRVELIPRLGASDPFLNQIGQALLQEMKESPADARLYAEQAAEMLAVHLLRNHCSEEQDVASYTGGIPPARLKRVKAYVEANLDDDIRLDDLAAEAEMSRYHFSRQFKKSVGVSPSQYVIERRIERSKTLLKEKDWLIARVALEVGYESQSRFTTQFKRRVGTTPGRFREGR